MGKRWAELTNTYGVASNSSAHIKSNNVNDSLDGCNYRIIQKISANNVPMFNHGYVHDDVSFIENTSFDLSDCNSSDDLTINFLEDTLAECYYRRANHNNLQSVLSDQDDTLAYNDVIAKHSLNEAMIDFEYVDDTNASFGNITGTLDAFDYRRPSTPKSTQHSPGVPTQQFCRLLVPYSHFSPSPIARASLPRSNDSSFLAQFSDQSDDNINLSSE